MEKITAYQLDMDGNAFFLNTKAYVQVLKNAQRIEECLTATELAQYENQKIQVRYDEEKGLEDFRNDDALIRDFQEMLDTNNFGYSEAKLRSAFVYAQEVSFNTARGHSVGAIKEALRKYIMQKFDDQEKEYMIYNIRKNLHVSELANFENALNTYFQNNVQIYAVKGDQFAELLDVDVLTTSVESLKPLAYHHYVDHLIAKYGSDQMIAVGFSEDTEKYLKGVGEYIKEHILTNPVYDHIYPKLYHTISRDTSVDTILRSKREVHKNFLSKR